MKIILKNQQRRIILPFLLLLSGVTSTVVANPLGRLADQWYVGGSLGRAI